MKSIAIVVEVDWVPIERDDWGKVELGELKAGTYRKFRRLDVTSILKVRI